MPANMKKQEKGLMASPRGRTTKETSQLKEVQVEVAVPWKEMKEVEMSIQSNDLLTNNCPNHPNSPYPKLTFAQMPNDNCRHG